MRKPRLRHVAAATVAVTGMIVGGSQWMGNACGCSTPTIPVAPDTTAPAVSITSPSGGTVVSGPSSTVTATATDNIAVVGVQFKIDGSNLGGEDLVSPFTFNWNTTVYADGAHSLTAVARDAAGNTTTSASVSITVTNSGTVLNLYHEFVAPAGTTTCTRNPNLIDYASALSANNVCTTFSKAYAISTDGDTIGVESASYAAQSIANIAKTITGACNYWPAAKDVSGCITFEPDGGGAPKGASVTISSIFTAASYLRLKNMQITGGAAFSWKNTITGRPCQASTPQPHDIVLDGIEFNGASSSFNINSLYNVSIVNSQFDGNQDISGGSNIAAFLLNQASSDCNTTSWPGLTQTQLNPAQIYIHNDVWNGLVQTNNGPPTPHEQCLHIRYANDYEISDNKFLNCSSYDINLESQGTSSPTRNLDNGLIAGNVFDVPCSNQVTLANSGTCNPIQPFAIICHSAGDTITNLTVAFNTIHSGASIWQQAGGTGACNPGTSATFAGDVFVGNASDSASQCVTGRGITYAYNTWASGSTCVASDQIAAANFTAASPTTYDFTPAAGSALIGFVPVSSSVGGVDVECPNSDANGFARPAGGQTNCAGGGLEPLVASNQTHGSGMGSSLTEHSLSSPLINTLGNATGTNGTTYYYTYRCATCTSGSNDGPYPLIIELTGSPSGNGATCSGAARTAGGGGLGYSQAIARCIIGGSAASLTNVGQLKSSGWETEADACACILVAPTNVWLKCQGTTDPGCGATGTNVNFHSFAGDYGNDGTNHGDGGYYTTTWFDSAKQVLDAVNGAESLANVDTSKIFLVGDSSGGNFAEQLYCNASTWTFQSSAPTVTPPFLSGATTFYETPQAALVNTIDGMGLWSATLRATAKNVVPGGQGAYGCSSPQTTHSIPIMHVHGDADSSVPYLGGTPAIRTGCGSITTGNSCFTSQAQELAFWFTGGGGMGCSSTPSSGPTTTGHLVITVYGTGCAGGHAYRTDTVTGGSHDAFIYTDGCSISTAGTTCTENIPLQIYNFLSTH